MLRPRRTALFAKLPAPGSVKTRLVPPLTPEGAAELAECMVLDLAERLARWSETDPLGPALRHAPAEGGRWFAARVPASLELWPQRGADLGARLAAHFAEEARRFPGATLVVFGADAPLLGRATVLAAHAALAEGSDLVLSPDRGGGYALIGLRAPRAELFTEVPMSSGGMCERTLSLAQELGLATRVLAPTADVDVAADLEHLEHALELLAPEHPDRPQRTEAWLRAFRRSSASG